jgi:hypothetical protein
VKVVDKLKKKHRGSIWLDRDGEVWYYEWKSQAWGYLWGGAGMGGPGLDFDTLADPTLYGPFTRLHKVDR